MLEFCHKALLKIFVLKNITLTALITFFAPAWAIFSAAIYMIFLDFICAMVGLFIRKERFKSNLSWKTPGKMLLVLLVFTGIRMLDLGLQEHVGIIVPTFLQLSVWFCALICVAELFSIDETFQKIMGYSFFNLISDKLSMITKYLKFNEHKNTIATNE